MKTTYKKAIICIAPLFMAACASKPYEREVILGDKFDQTQCSAFQEVQPQIVKGKGDNVKVIEEKESYFKYIATDSECVKDNNIQRIDSAVAYANRDVKIAAIKSMAEILTAMLTADSFDPELKKQILEDIITDMNSGIEDVVKIRQGSLEKAGVTFEEIQKQYHMIKVAEDIDNTIATIYPEDGEFSPKYARYLLDEVYEGKAYPYTDLSLDNIRHYVDQALAEKSTSVEQLRHAYVQAAPQQGWEKQDDGTFKLSFDFSKFAPSKAPEQSLMPPLATPANDSEKPVAPAKPETTVRAL